MKIKSSHTTNSSIIAEGVRLQKAMKETGKEYLLLNRGINSVVNINLEPIISQINFNSSEVQTYPGAKGKIDLRQAINQEYFGGEAAIDNILITGGGISGLDTCFQNLDINEIVLPKFFWGTYVQLARLRSLAYSCYESYKQIKQSPENYKGKALIICDPGNPLGEKCPDVLLYEVISTLNNHGATVLVDSPYRRLYFDKNDGFYQKLMKLENIIIIESFSKSLGLSGQRIGFLYSNNPEFISEAQLRIMYATNGINSFAQILVTQLLDSETGREVTSEFKLKTTADIKKNIEFLEENKLLAREFYSETSPIGIFSVIKKSTDELFRHRIGGVGLDYFMEKPFAGMENYSRILVSYPHEKFVSFFRTLILSLK